MDPVGEGGPARPASSAIGRFAAWRLARSPSHSCAALSLSPSLSCRCGSVWSSWRNLTESLGITTTHGTTQNSWSIMQPGSDCLFTPMLPPITNCARDIWGGAGDGCFLRAHKLSNKRLVTSRLLAFGSVVVYLTKKKNKYSTSNLKNSVTND